ncbi:RCC1 domain-containing protein 1 isoform X2 [Octodon degus]|uniref:RCC1 domain-containing protein 1 isoform X2 n=1 Tax=Octodon degus TaxID=10160 RepID=A0A6P6E257_OCTDE|nr:RCC1 domain-containing protein 1 isoform X2 [Octodon degus]
MAEERLGSWFGFGFCGFGQEPGSGCRHQVLSPEPLQAGGDIRHVSASWSYTTLVTRGGRVELSGSTSGSAGGCRDAWASEGLLVLLRDSPGSQTELQAWAPSSALCGEPLWAQDPEADGAELGAEAQMVMLPLLPGARAYVSPRPPYRRSLAPELRARQLELGAEHVLLLDAAGQTWTAGPWDTGGRTGAKAAGGTAGPAHGPGGSGGLALETRDLYIWGWNESGQLALPTRSLAEDKRTVTGEGLNQDGSEVERAARAEGGASAPFIAVQPFPALLDLPLGSEAVGASCGSRHTAVVTRTGELYTWGWGKYGQLGHQDSTSLDRPCRVEYFVEKQLQVKTVTCGPWNTYVYAVENRNG